MITTVGYGDYSMATTSEYCFMLALEFIGMIVFSMLMSSVSAVFGANDSFDDLVENKLEQLDIWIKKLEKSCKMQIGSNHL